MFNVTNLTLRSALSLTVAVSIAAFASGCAREISSQVYSEAHVGEASKTFFGRIINVRKVVVQGQEKLDQNATGMAMGAIAGGVAGTQLGGGRGRIATTAGGALLGAVAGAMIQKGLESQDALEYTVELHNGELRSVVQGTDNPLAVGQNVLIMVSRDGRSRVVPAQ
ncbi:MAG: glycine zipper 2TM domain-containing protein [Candidatus Nucleicultricaceae bacterium]